MTASLLKPKALEEPAKSIFPGFELNLQLPPRFKDTSWHINQTPSFDKGRPDGTVLLLWVDHPDRALSSLSGQVSCFRVSLARYTEDDE